MSRSGKTAIRGMTESEIKLLSSLPGIETSVVELVTTLSSLVSQSADRETRLLNKIDLLTKQVNALSEDVVSLKEAAIVSASVSPQAQCQRTSKTSRRRSARKAGSAATATNDPSNNMSTTTAHRSVCDSVSDTDDTESSDQEATHPAAARVHNPPECATPTYPAVPTEFQVDVIIYDAMLLAPVIYNMCTGVKASHVFLCNNLNRIDRLRSTTGSGFV